MPDFEVISPYEPSGDQPEAIDTLVQGWKTASPSSAARRDRLRQ